MWRGIYLKLASLLMGFQVSSRFVGSVELMAWRVLRLCESFVGPCRCSVARGWAKARMLIFY
jgi:hypothetical protein